MWFISADEQFLIQFQSDRFIFNWRKRGDDCHYPSFDTLIPRFTRNFSKLFQYAKARLDVELKINQVEVAYINVLKESDFSKASDFQSIFNDSILEVEGVSLAFGEIVRGADGTPMARLVCELNTGFREGTNERIYRLALTSRGAPETDEIEGALGFMRIAHKDIVMKFTDITTANAHRRWRKLDTN